MLLESLIFIAGLLASRPVCIVDINFSFTPSGLSAYRRAELYHRRQACRVAAMPRRFILRR